VRSIVLATLALVGLSAGVLAQTILKQEPKMGGLREGETVLVDDGKCPKGQIRRVTGGNHVKAGGSKQITRSSQCISR
jgi:hypothetical protein